MSTIMNRKNNEKGFTLIELIMVIVILGILAAVAIPKFIDLQGKAATSVQEGMTGAINGAIVMLHAQYILDTAQTYDGTTIAGQVDTSGVGTVTSAAGTITAPDINNESCEWTISGTLGIASKLTTVDPTCT